MINFGLLKRFFSEAVKTSKDSITSAARNPKNSAATKSAKFSAANSTGRHSAPSSNNTMVGKIITRLVNMRVVKNMTKNGKIARFSAIVVAGTGNGGLGTGHAKHDSASEAVLKAGRLAVKNIQFFNRWQDRTIFHDDYVKFKATKLYVRPAPPSNTDKKHALYPLHFLSVSMFVLDTGRRCHPTIAEMCRCLGIKDISAKVHGSSHPMNVMKAFLLALERQKSPEQVSAESGMKVVDVLKVFETNCRQRPLRGSHEKVV